MIDGGQQGLGITAWLAVENLGIRWRRQCYL